MDPALNVLLDELDDSSRRDGFSVEDSLYESFHEWAESTGRPLYPHQDEALAALLTGSHVIVSTPTGSGKSMVALAAHTVALARGERTYYTAPLKALVSEKFFDLVALFGASNVGMVTGDSAVNSDAPIICCTAEILANQALREGAELDAGVVVMDEFHFYAEPDRGWAWQVPLLELTRAQFVLMSATLGDTGFFADDLVRRTGREVETVTSAVRPVPLSFAYSVEPLQEVIEELVHTHRAPAYVVHFAQRDAVERAGSLTSLRLVTPAEKAAIAEKIGHVQFSKGFGVTLSRLLRLGIGVHHAGMLPRYRRLVEQLTQDGLLKVVCGTDTLGVGINVPIRTVVFTGLTKFDGERQRHLTAREFHQIAGRAGRAGFDTVGEVIVQAPEHVIENAKALAKAGDDPKKKRKIVRKKAPAGQVNWTDATFERLRDSEPEPLTSQFHVTHAMVLNVLSRPGDGVGHMAKLLTDNHEPPSPRNPHIRRACHIYRSLRQADVVEHLSSADAAGGPRLRLTVDLPDQFALNAPLSPFALAAIGLLDPESPEFALDVISVIEATLEDPRPLLYAQRYAAAGEAVAAMKAEGLEYDARMDALEDVTWPQPLADTLIPALRSYAHTNPWVLEHELSPKSVVREMVEHAMTFSDLIARYQLGRSEGVILRYLTDAYRALRQVVPADARTPEVAAITEWLGHLVRAVDSSLLDEWARLNDDDGDSSESAGEVAFTSGDGAVGFAANRHAFRTAVRTAAFRRVELLSREAYEGLAALGGGWSADDWADAADSYWEAHDLIGIGLSARGGDMFEVVESPGGADWLDSTLPEAPDSWVVWHRLEDPEGDGDWFLTLRVDVGASVEDLVVGEARLVQR